MLNISSNSIADKIKISKYSAFSLNKEYKAARIFALLLFILLAGFIASMFLPWTQNISTKGYLTSLRPDQRPQTLNSVIAGKIEKWYVREGDLLKKGDTILYISEIKDDYFDPQLLDRTQKQINAKELSVGSYLEKAKALEGQIVAMEKTRILKLDQAKNYTKQARLKVMSDSTELQAAVINFEVAEEQYKRMEEMYKDGLRPLTDLEARRLKLQETLAKRISQENKLLASRNELINAQIELGSLENQFQDKIAKAESERFATLSGMYDSEAAVTKMQNQYMNYSVRTGLYYVLAPQDGYITKAYKTGIGEMFKEGEPLLSIMPANYEIAAELYIDPVDLPLIHLESHVRLLFDGWPAIVFTGWPNSSFGTYGGKVVAIDNVISSNNKYRVLVVPDKQRFTLPRFLKWMTAGGFEEDKNWPQALRPGAGVKGFALLKDVKLGYELWRQLNGFPPEFYDDKPSDSPKGKGEKTEKEAKEEEVKQKPALKSFK